MSQVYYNDIEHFPCEVLRKNIMLGNLPEGFVDERDIKQVQAADLMGYSRVHLFAGIGGFELGFHRANVPLNIRILTGGFPCQDISNAGKRAGITGKRSGLWSEQYRLIQDSLDCGAGFDYVVVENVAALVNRGLSTVLADLAKAGYDAEWQCLRASDFSAPHQRERIFIVAYPDSTRSQTTWTEQQSITPRQCCQDVAYPNGDRQWIREDQQERQPASVGRSDACDDGTQESMAHSRSAGQQEQHTTTITGEPGYVAWRKIAPGKPLVEDSTSRRERQYQIIRGEEQTQPLDFQSGAGDAECRVRRVFNGLPDGMDRYNWPAGPGQAQHDWEPTRTITERQPQRVARLKALGNAIVPQIAEYIGLQIISHYNDDVTRRSEAM